MNMLSTACCLNQSVRLLKFKVVPTFCPSKETKLFFNIHLRHHLMSGDTKAVSVREEIFICYCTGIRRLFKQSVVDDILLPVVEFFLLIFPTVL